MSLGIYSQDSLIYKVEKYRIDNAARIFLKYDLCQKELINLHEQVLILNEIVLSKDELIKLVQEQLHKQKEIDLNNEAVIKEKDTDLIRKTREIRKQKILKVIYPIVVAVVLITSYVGLSSGGVSYR
jgi:hypothetical protein